MIRIKLSNQPFPLFCYYSPLYSLLTVYYLHTPFYIHLYNYSSPFLKLTPFTVIVFSIALKYVYCFSTLGFVIAVFTINNMLFHKPLPRFIWTDLISNLFTRYMKNIILFSHSLCKIIFYIIDYIRLLGLP